MARQTSAAPVVADLDALDEFMEVLRDYAPTIEHDVIRLRREPGEAELIRSLFRTLHNIKGDAGLCRIDLAVSMVHPLETVLDRVRSSDLPFTDSIAQAILLTIDRLDLAMERLVAGRSLDGLELGALVEGLEKLAVAAPNKVDKRVAEIIEAVTGTRPAFAGSLSTGSEAEHLSKLKSQEADDLLFFLTLANQFEARSPRLAGRTMRVLRLALDTNAMAGSPVDPVQLEAAVYMHDLGMMFLPDSLWLTAGTLSDTERRLVRSHPSYAAGLLSRMPNWSAAAEMVAQHHEMPDGHGYPNGTAAAQICAGAKVLAMVDAFEALMLKHGDSGRKRSLLRAIAEINACDAQFAPEWIEPFNRVIRLAAENP